jgi:ubiquinone/menaquinone biosynthesis C-methylase UbiE
MEDRKQFFDRHACTWDEDLRYGEKSSRLAEVVSWFRLTNGNSVLDVGTGTGVLLPFLRGAIGREGKLVAIDFSYKMLELAKSRMSQAENLVANATVEAIPTRSDQFDRVTCFSAFPHFPNKPRALLEMARVLKTGGLLSIAHLHSVEEINQLHQGVGEAVRHDQLPHPERLRDLMGASGFFEISIVNQPGKFLAQGQKI